MHSGPDLVVPPVPAAAAWRFVAALAGLASAALVTAGAIVYSVDPFQHFRAPRDHSPRYYRQYQRHLDPGLARHAEYDIVVTGTSLMENFVNSEVGRSLGGRAINLSIGAMTAYEMRRLLEVALATGRPRQIVMDLSFNSFALKPDGVLTPDPFPEYLYGTGLRNHMRYLLQALPLKLSMEMLAGASWSRYSTDADRPWYWGDEYEFSRRAAVRGLDPQNINALYKLQPMDLGRLKQNFIRNVLPLLQSHPEVRFTLVWPPYSILAWIDLRQRGAVETALAFRTFVAESVAGHPNTDIFDFQADDEITDNLDHYKDIFHYSPAISRWMLEQIAHRDRRSQLPDIETNNRRIRAQALVADP